MIDWIVPPDRLTCRAVGAPTELGRVPGRPLVGCSFKKMRVYPYGLKYYLVKVNVEYPSFPRQTLVLTLLCCSVPQIGTGALFWINRFPVSCKRPKSQGKAKICYYVKDGITGGNNPILVYRYMPIP